MVHGITANFFDFIFICAHLRHHFHEFALFTGLKCCTACSTAWPTNLAIDTGGWQLKISITFPTLNWVINGLKNPRLWGENWTRQVNVCVTLDLLVLFEYLQVCVRVAGTKIAAVNILMKKSFSTRNFDWKATAFDSAPPVCLVTPKRSTTKTPNGRYWFDTLMWGYRTYLEFAINASMHSLHRKIDNIVLAGCSPLRFALSSISSCHWDASDYRRIGDGLTFRRF